MNFSIIIPIYNTQLLGDFFLCCKQQIFSKGKFEIIIVDDGSDLVYQKKYQIEIEKYRTFPIKYHYIDDKKGRFRVNQARNIGTKMAEFEYVIYVDGDSLIPYYYLENFSYILQNSETDIYIGESVGYNFDSLKEIRVDDIVLGNYKKYLEKSEFADFRKKGNYKHLWHVFLGGNFCVHKRILQQIGPWNETLKFWGEDDIDFAFRAYKMGFQFKMFDTIELYNIANSERMTRKKFYGILQNQCVLFQKYGNDREYLEYILQRFHFTPTKYKVDNIPKAFQVEILDRYYG